jgi:peptide/nickel transport system substrate-binding protein
MRSVATKPSLTAALRRRLTLSTLSVAAILTLAISGCTTTGNSTDEIPDTIRIGVSTLGGAYNPATSSLSSELDQRAVYESLFTPNSSIEGGGYDPVLATGYERSEDWKTITLSLREGVTFVDGEEFTAEALKDYLEGMAEVPEWWFLSYWDSLAPTLTAVDDSTLEITSDKAMTLDFFQPIFFMFTQLLIASPNTVDDVEAAATDPLGSGPYIIESVTPDVGATLVRNENYWNPDAFPFDTVELTVFADDVAAHNALTAGQIDAASLGVPLAVEAEGAGFTLNVESAGGTTHVLFIADRDGKANPAMADQRVRQAMALAFDRAAIKDALDFGYGDLSTQPFIEGQPGYVEGGDDRYAYDPERAKELLAEAGYPDGFDLVILSDPSNASNGNQPLVQQYLGDIGIRVTFETLESGAFFDAAINTQNYPVIMYGNLFLSTFGYFLAPNAIFNSFKVQDPYIDERWETVMNGPDAPAAEAMEELGDYVVDESLLIVYRAAPGGIWVTAPGFTVPYFYALPLLNNFKYEG